MRWIRAAVVAAVLGGSVMVAAPVGAGNLPLTVTGAATCDTTTGQYTLTWTVTNVSDSQINDVTGTQTPPGAAVIGPVNILPAGSVQAVTNLPGTTVGAVTLAAVIVGGPSIPGTVNLTGCTQVVEAVEAPPRTVG
jgi:hypothetical protein